MTDIQVKRDAAWATRSYRDMVRHCRSQQRADQEINDQAARIIAACFQSSGSVGSVLASFASGRKVNAGALYADIQNTIAEVYETSSDNDKLLLDMLGTWVLRKTNDDDPELAAHLEDSAKEPVVHGTLAEYLAKHHILGARVHDADISCGRLGAGDALTDVPGDVTCRECIVLRPSTEQKVSEEPVNQLPASHQVVIDLCVAEAWRNLEQNDALAPADVAADIVRYLNRVYVGEEE